MLSTQKYPMRIAPLLVVLTVALVGGCATAPTVEQQVAMQQRQFDAPCATVFDATRTVVESQGFAIAQADRAAMMITTEPRSAGTGSGAYWAAALLVLPVKWNISMRCGSRTEVNARLFNVMRDGTSAEMRSGESVAGAYKEFYERLAAELAAKNTQGTSSVSAPAAPSNATPAAAATTVSPTSYRSAPNTPLSRDAIMKAQERLNALGFAVGSPDGRIGPRSQAAIVKFQSSKGLPATGELSSETMKALGF